MNTLIAIPGQSTQTYSSLEESVQRLFNAYINYTSKDIPELSREGFVIAFNNRITKDIYNILNSAPELIEEFLLFLVQLGVLKSFKDNAGLTAQNAIVISTSSSLNGNYHNAGVLGIFVVGNADVLNIKFYKTNLHATQTLPPNADQIMSQKVILNAMDSTVDTTEFITLKEMASTLQGALEEGKTITFCVDQVKDEPVVDESNSN
ncbi:MAG: hypothetical protein ABIM99_03105 [Candidatus Dojkabacteria bacterium]